MSLIDTPLVSASLQTLIDARLDAVDRALLGRTSRQERITVVGEVEARIHELLHERCGTAEPLRDDVLAVISRLDPPEAYLSEDVSPAETRAVAPQMRPAPASSSRLAWWCGVLGLASLAMILAALLAHRISLILMDQITVRFAVTGTALLGPIAVIANLAALRLASRRRLARFGWAIVGLVASLLASIIVGAVITWVPPNRFTSFVP
jgi:hypothetical protein